MKYPTIGSGKQSHRPLLHGRRVRLAALDDTVPELIEDFVRAHVKHGTTLLTYGDKPNLDNPRLRLFLCGNTVQRYRNHVGSSHALSDWFANRDGLTDDLVREWSQTVRG